MVGSRWDVGIVKVGDIDHALEVVGLGQATDDLIHLVADFFVALQRHHVGKAASLGHVEEGILSC